VGLFERIVAAASAKADESINEGAPIDPSGTHAVLPLDRELFHDGRWVALPAGKTKIEYQVNKLYKRNGRGYLPVLFELTLQTETGELVEISRPLAESATCKGIGNVYTRTPYGKVELARAGNLYARASGQVYLNCEAHLRFV
jgi:hypothetical protein